MQKLPEELREALFSGETAEHVFDACTRNGIEDARISEVGRLVGKVLVGLLLPEEFQGALIKEVRLGRVAAEKIARELNRFVFFPVKAVLAQLHVVKTEGAPVVKKVQIQKSVQSSTQPKKADTYRESIEESEE